MDQIREVLRYHHYAYRTKQTYCQWILCYIRFFGGKVHPRDLISQPQSHIKHVKALHHCDREEGFGEVYIPVALGWKYKNAAME